MIYKKSFENLYTYLDKITNNGYYYNTKNMLSYHRPFNIIAASRSTGKTTNVACLCLLNYKINGKMFLYSRRTQDTTRKGARDFLTNAKEIIERKTDLRFGNIYYHAGYFWEEFTNENGDKDKRAIGSTISLSDVYKDKSAVMPHTDIIVYDEFIAESKREYLGTLACPEEYDRLINLYQTVDRDIEHPVLNETTVLLMGNTSTIYNPVYQALDMSLYIKRGAHFIRPKGKLWILEQLEGVPATADIENSVSFQMSTEDQKHRLYKNYALQDDYHKYVKKTNHFLMPKTNVILDNKKYCLYFDPQTKEAYFMAGAHSTVKTISLDVGSTEGHDTRLILRWQNDLHLQIAGEKFCDGLLFFDSQNTAIAIMRYLQFIE